jgi:CRP/FNR family transcriptional regulator
MEITFMDVIKDKLDNFFAKYPIHNYSAGEILVFAGDQPPGIMFIISGLVQQYDISSDGRKIILNIFKANAFFPMSWAFSPEPSRYFFEAGDKVSLKLAPRKEVLEFLNDNPDVAIDLLRRLYKGVDGVMGRLSALMSGSAENQIMNELLISGQRFGKLKDDGKLEIKIKTTELAERTGLTRETVSRKLSKLSKDNIISRRGSVIEMNL